MRISDWSSDVCSSDRVAGLHQRLDILRETRAAIATTRVEKLEADARIGADAAPHAFDIRTDFFGQQRQLVHEADAGREHGVGRIFGELGGLDVRSEEHTPELQSLMRISYAVFCLKKKKN